MLQIQHTARNNLLTRLKEALKFPHFKGFQALGLRDSVIGGL